MRKFYFLAALFCLPAFLNAQCLWQLDMFDSFGDGWNGGELTITSGPNSQTFTLDNINDDGISNTVFFDVFPGQPLVITWQAGSFLNEVSFTIYNVDNEQVLSLTAPPSGVVYNGTGDCPACVKPINVYNENIYDTRAKIRWTPGIGTSNPVGWWVIYGPAGFIPGPGQGDTLYVTTPKATITGLTPKTNYEYYIIQDCNGSTSNLTGPFGFETYWTNDVAVTEVLTPIGSCDLGVEIVRFAMTNLGSNPQTLIPYLLYVNGQPGGVIQPEDGYYTGVIGKDSTEIIEFETTYDFSEPGEYEIMVILQMTGDEDMSNDTLRYYLNNVLTAPYTQSFENWNGGWTVVNDLSAFESPSWEYGTPAGVAISAAGDGQKAWVTNLDGPVNAGERGYIVSTCFDFSDLTTKPALEFLINYSCTQGSNGAFVESSINDGATWQRIGSATTGVNWYNSTDPGTGQNTAWAGNSNGWIPTHHLIDGVAGQSNVLFRFGFASGFFPLEEGVGIDQFKIFTPLQKDMMAVKVNTLGEGNDCGLENDKVTLRIANVGGGPIPSGYTLYYSVNNGNPVQFTVPNNLMLPDENYAYTFGPTFDSRDAVSVIRCWVSTPGDLNTVNDTVTYTISHLPRPIPFRENFEAGVGFPQGWTVPANATVTNTHNNISNVLAFNLYSSFPSCVYDLPRYGVIGANDSLTFDYRITNWSAGTVGTVLSNDTKIDVKVSTDCGQTFETVGTINSLNHTPTANLRNRKISLENYAGKSITIRFEATWGAGDFWFDLDNVGIIACPVSMNLTASVTPEIPGQSAGSATVQVGIGNPPYSYLWSNGATTASVSDLIGGSYTVTVNDANGCSDTLTVFVQVSGTSELPGMQQLSIRPNPTNGLLLLDVQFDQTLQVQSELVNLLGQAVWKTEQAPTQSIHEWIDLSTQPSGIYLLRIVANGAVLTKKVILQK